MHKQVFNDIVEQAMRQPGRNAMRPVVEKEILHYDIFQALDRDGLLKNLVFQGGTSLRLCRGSSRFSEDLDFAGGRDFNASALAAIKNTIETHIGKRYGLVVNVKEPKAGQDAEDPSGIIVDKWQVSVETAPERKDLPRQRIKIEIANIPAYTCELVPLRLNYDFLQGYSGDVLVNTETIDEVMADKVLAFPASHSHIRHRDIWDLAWLVQKGAKLDPSMVLKKAEDYRTENYFESLESAIIRLPEIIHSKEFIDQMTRFIDQETIKQTLAKPTFLDYLSKTVGNVFKDMAAEMSNAPKDEATTFRM
jgi:hypothetical protein